MTAMTASLDKRIDTRLVAKTRNLIRLTQTDTSFKNISSMTEREIDMRE